VAVVETWKLTDLTCRQAILRGLMPKCNHWTSSGWEDADDEIAPLEEDVGVMDDENEDVAHEELEQETDDVVSEIDADSAHRLTTLTSRHRQEALFVIKKVVGFASALCNQIKKPRPFWNVANTRNSSLGNPSKWWLLNGIHTLRHLIGTGKTVPLLPRLCSVAIYEHLKVEKYALRQQEWCILGQLRPLLHVRNVCLTTQVLY